MIFKKPLLVAGVATTIAVASIAGASAATSDNSNTQDNLVNKIAKKFNLKPAEVKAVFEENRAEHEAKADQKVEEKLTQLVKDGKLTEAQKSAILAKRAEIKKDMESNHDAIKEMTPEERKTAMDQKKTELDNWAKENNIPTQYLRLVFGHGHGGHGMGHRGPGGHGHMDGDSDDNVKPQSSTQSSDSTSDDNIMSN